VQEDDRPNGVSEMTATTAMISQDAPVLEASDGVLDPGSASTMATPGSVAQDPVSPERRRDELGDSAVPTVGEHATVLLTKRFDVRAAVVHRVVAVAGTTGVCGDDSQIASADQDLGVTRPAVVLGTGRASMVAGRNQRAIDHPRFAPVRGAALGGERGESWGHRRNDPMRRGLRDREARSELSDREVGSQRGTRDQDALRERA